VPEAFGKASDGDAVARTGKRQKRGTIAAATAVPANDPTQARVEGILAAGVPTAALAAAGAGQEDVVQELI
jgi:hypothetical protein